MADKKISELTLATPDQNDVIPFVDISDTTMGLSGTTKKATKADLKGDPGDNATVDVGTTETIASGLDAEVTNVGTTSDAILNFKIPKGSTIYSTIGIPNNSIGKNGDWAFDTSSNSYVYYKSAGAWALVNSNKGSQGVPGETGDTGNGIDNIALISTIGKEKTYRITYTDTTTFDYVVTDGNDGIDGLDITWKGEYNALTAYVINDAVFYNGSSYICILASTGNSPTNGTYWSLMAQKGADGEGAGDVLGPSSAVDENIAIFDGTTGKIIKDGGIKKATLTNRFNGACQIPTLTNNGNGTVTISSGDYCLSANADGSGVITTYTLAGLTNQALTDLTQNYIVANYNGGTPQLQVITDVTLINETTIVPVFSIFRNGNVLHVQNWDALGLALANKVHQSIVKTQRYRRESGLALSESGTRNLNLTAGRVWTGAVPITLDAIATATDNMFLWYHSAGNWTVSTQTQYNNTQYDNGTNLASLGVNRYAVNWIFRGVESQKHLYVVLGTGDYTLAQAQSATLPAIPPAISSHAVLVAKLIVQNGSNTATSIQSAFDTQFSLSTVQSHGDLINRDTVGSHPAGSISNTPAGNISSTDVQSAINELDTEKLSLAGGNMTGAINEAKGADIASASSIDIGAGTGNFIDITGTTTITALGTVQAGTERTLRFTGVLTLTHNATSLILPTGANITTQAGDTAIFRSLGSGNWKCINYQRADGSALVGGGRTYGSTTSSATPTINTDLYDRYELTSQNQNITSFTTNLSGTPKDGDKLNIKISTPAGNPSMSLVNNNTYTSGAGTTNSVVLTKPTNTQDGDMMVVEIMGSSTDVTVTPPAGWTSIATQNPNIDLYTFYKIASSEGSSYTFSLSGSVTVRAGIGSYRLTGAMFNSNSPIMAVSNTQYITSDTILRAASLTTTKTYTPLIFMGFANLGSAPTINVPTSPATFSNDIAFNDGNFTIKMASLMWTGSGSTGNVDATINGSTTFKGAIMVAFNTVKQTYSITWGSSFDSKSYNLPLTVPVQSSRLSVDLIYNSLTSKWETKSNIDKLTSGIENFDVSSVSGLISKIPHNLDKIPTKIKITSSFISGTTNSSQSFGTFDNLNTNKSIYLWQKEGTSTAVADVAGNSTTQSIVISSDATSSNQQVGVITVDSYYINITWTKTGSPTGTAYIMWEAE